MPLRTSPLDDVLRAGGAVMVARAGALVPESFGSVPGEIAICEVGVGIVDRCDLLKLDCPEFAAEPEGSVWWAGGLLLIDPRQTPPPGLADRSDEFAVLALIGPKSQTLLDAADMATETIVEIGPASALVVVPVDDANATWHRLHDAGEPLRVGSVGLEAYEHYRASERARVSRHG